MYICKTKQTNKQRYKNSRVSKPFLVMQNVKPNIRGTLRRMAPGDTITLPASACRDSYLRNCATVLKELGYLFHVTKSPDGFLVFREA